ncbi:MAG TPA: 6-phosphogluconolactonase [Candidatus Angelobacter sp.]|nr:6-phosphogluconolactonase [Candidatus Angelobacter sp.]
MTQSSVSKVPEWMAVVSDTEALNHAAASEFVNCATRAIRERGRFSVALSGGKTPRAIYSLLAEKYANSISWEQVFVFFGDERHVPPEHPDSNFRMANESLLSRVPIPAKNIHRVQAELAAPMAADQYQATLREFFSLQDGELPQVDLVMLGMGEDGHTASLFPGTAALEETSRTVVANHVEKLQADRITLTFPVLNAANEVLIIIAGENKAPVVRDIVNSPEKCLYPIQRVRPRHGRLLWLVEQQAASLI